MYHIKMEALLQKIGQLNNTANADYHRVLEGVLRNTIDMLKDRGYNVTNDCRTVGDISYKMEEGDHILSGDASDGTSTIVFFHNEERVGVKQLRVWNEKFAGSFIVIVSLEGPTAFTKREADHHYKNTQFFTFRQLCVNITRHALVPKHERCADKVPYQVGNKDEWPKLYTNDPIAQYYNYKEGDLIRITRTIGYPEPVYFYRLVCLPPVA